jgi:large subunit ribosomal protein L3
MSIGLFTRKIGMTQVFDKDGALLPVTILRAEPCKISQIKTIQTDGYNAVQVAYCKEKFNKLTQAQQGHLKNLNGEGFKFFGEFRVKDPNAYK